RRSARIRSDARLQLEDVRRNEAAQGAMTLDGERLVVALATAASGLLRLEAAEGAVVGELGRESVIVRHRGREPATQADREALLRGPADVVKEPSLVVVTPAEAAEGGLPCGTACRDPWRLGLDATDIADVVVRLVLQR